MPPNKCNNCHSEKCFETVNTPVTIEMAGKFFSITSVHYRCRLCHNIIGTIIDSPLAEKITSRFLILSSKPEEKSGHLHKLCRMLVGLNLADLEKLYNVSSDLLHAHEEANTIIPQAFWDRLQQHIGASLKFLVYKIQTVEKPLTPPLKKQVIATPPPSWT